MTGFCDYTKFPIWDCLTLSQHNELCDPSHDNETKIVKGHLKDVPRWMRLHQSHQSLHGLELIRHGTTPLEVLSLTQQAHNRGNNKRGQVISNPSFLLFRSSPSPLVSCGCPPVPVFIPAARTASAQPTSKTSRSSHCHRSCYAASYDCTDIQHNILSDCLYHTYHHCLKFL